MKNGNFGSKNLFDVKKAVFLLLAIALLFSVSCTNAQNSNESFDLDFDAPAGDDFDLEGTHFYMLTNWTIELLPEAGRSLAADLVRARYAEVEEKYNCEIEVKYSATHVADFNAALATSMHVPDIFQAHANEIYPFYKQNVLLALEDIDTIDATDLKWGYKHYLQYGNFDGKQYGFFPNNWLIMPEVTGVTVFNNEILMSYGLSKYPYELKEQDNWTWSEFETLLGEVSSNVGGVKVYGLGFDDLSVLSKSAIFSNGGEIVVQSSDGKYASGLSSENVYQALDYISGLNKAGYTKNGDYSPFTNGEYVFWHCDSWKATIDYEGHEDYPLFTMQDYGMIDFPYGPNGDTTKSNSFIHRGRKLCWPVAMTANDHSIIGILMDAIFAPLPGMEEFAWMDYAKNNLFHHLEGYETFSNAIATTHYDYSVQLGSTMDKITGAFTKVFNGNESGAAAIAAIDAAVTQAIAESLN